MPIKMTYQRDVHIWPLIITWLALAGLKMAQAADIALSNATNSSISDANTTQMPALGVISSSSTSIYCPHHRVHVLPPGHQLVYRVGVLGIRGPEAAWAEFNTTFGDYLTATAGQRFDPPLKFEMKPLDFLSLFTDTQAGLVDLIYVNPSAFSCIGK